MGLNLCNILILLADRLEIHKIQTINSNYTTETNSNSYTNTNYNNTENWCAHNLAGRKFTFISLSLSLCFSVSFSTMVVKHDDRCKQPTDWLSYESLSTQQVGIARAIEVKASRRTDPIRIVGHRVTYISLSLSLSRSRTGSRIRIQTQIHIHIQVQPKGLEQVNCRSQVKGSQITKTKRRIRIVK